MSTDLSLPPTLVEPRGTCPWCRRVSNFRRSGNLLTLASHPVFRQPHEASGPSMGSVVVGIPEPIPLARTGTLMCMGCERTCVVVEERLIDTEAALAAADSDRVVARTDAGGAISAWKAVNWWPLPGQAPLDPSIPETVQKPFAEGLRALSAGAPNAAASTLRAALVALIDNKGSADAKAKRDLVDKLKQFVQDGGLAPALGDWAEHVRLYGNAGAHPDVYGDVTMEEARDVANLLHSLLEAVYVLPANIAKRRAERMAGPG